MIIKSIYFTIWLFIGLTWAIKANPLPIPQNITWYGNEPIIINLDSLDIQLLESNSIIQDAFYRTIKTIQRLKWYPATFEQPIPEFESIPAPPSPPPFDKRNYRIQQCFGLQSIIIDVNDFEADLQLSVDESYTLDINEHGLHISADTIWGVLHAFSTLQQLIIYENGLFQIESSVSIIDYPKYKHRGLMIDSGRNYLSIDSILQQIDIMSLSKMNSLHWHLVDSQSWPIYLNAYPEMIKDAYSPREIYTKQDILYVIDYAFARGVRVIPEVDMPGHARAGWKQVNPEIVTCGNSWWSNDYWANHTAVEPPPGQLNILLPDTYEVIKNVYQELSDIFLDDVFHVGADELQSTCYNFSSLIQNEWFSKNKTMSQLTQHYIDLALPIFYNVSQNRKLMMWEDIVTTPEGVKQLPRENLILQSWSADPLAVKNLTRDGYDVIVSSSSHLYLDCGYGGWVTNDPRYLDTSDNLEFNNGLGGSWCAPYKTWQRIYDYDFAMNLTDTEAAHIIGAEAALWSEQVDSTVLTSKIWPRTAALAESTWSGNRDGNGNLRTNWLTSRILNFREYLVSMGYGASPLVPKFCLQNPHACDLYKNQTVLNGY
ncbi:HEX1 [[Candida] subhashii]|uniref:Beta-hexosaminidase n=1 Tax=[Candida] subhashii TaxID=561895 RepID=A0A8J5QCH2_9ASCO|nr:HEX1 [[Candida] subhashii]KAG7660942.1 HEX1 [[Candida] subhashii]